MSYLPVDGEYDSLARAIVSWQLGGWLSLRRFRQLGRVHIGTYAQIALELIRISDGEVMELSGSRIGVDRRGSGGWSAHSRSFSLQRVRFGWQKGNHC